MKDGDSALDHIKVMTELFDSLAVAKETVSEEDQVVYLLANLPDSYVLVTALKANEDVPKLEVVMERILHQERKSKDRSEASSNTGSAMTTRRSYTKRPNRCNHFGRLGHIKKYSRYLKAENEGQKEKLQKAAAATTHENSDSENSGLVASHALSTSNSVEQSTWIVDSGDTCHICHNRKTFATL